MLQAFVTARPCRILSVGCGSSPDLRTVIDQVPASATIVLCDSDKDALQSFVKDDPGMAWPQLFDAAENPKLNWHPLAKQYGINGIPTMFLIDKKGVLRTVKARENFEEMIPKLLAE